MDAVWTGIGVFAAGDDYKEIGLTEGNLFLFFVVFTNEAHQFFEMSGTVFYLCTTQFAFYEGVTAVFHVQDDIGLQAVAVTVVGDFTVERGAHVSPGIVKKGFQGDVSSGLSGFIQTHGIHREVGNDSL